MKQRIWLMVAAVALTLVGAGCAQPSPTPQASQPPAPAETVSVDKTVDDLMADVNAEASDEETGDVSELKSTEEDANSLKDADYEPK